MPEHEYRYLSKEKEWTTLKLEQLDGEIPDGLKLLGTGTGINLQHCIFEGILNCTNFMQRVTAFKVEGKDEFAQVLEDEIKLSGKVSTYSTITFWEKG